MKQWHNGLRISSRIFYLTQNKSNNQLINTQKSLYFFIYFNINMNPEVRQHLISSSILDSLIYILPIEFVIEHFSNFSPSYRLPQGKNIRVCYFVLFDSFESFKLVQNKLQSFQKTFIYNASLTGFQSMEQINQHIKMMQKMNESQFENQYIEMLELLQKQIEVSLMKELCTKQLRWSQAKITNLIQREGIKTMNEFLNYRGFNQLQNLKIKQIREFLHKYNKFGDN